MRIAISATYYASTTGIIDLPEGKTWDDVEHWFVKWDTFHYRLKGEKDYREIELCSDPMNIIDWKRPSTVEVYPTLEDDEIDWDNPLYDGLDG